MALKAYPIGIQTFEEIINKNFLYIDKTEYVYRMTHSDGMYFFLGRPRRFGKSLLVSTMKSYFEGRKDLFKGLAIEKLEKEWTEYPVLLFDMSGGKNMDGEKFERYLLDILEEQEKKFGYKSDEKYANIRLLKLIDTVYRQTGKQVVVLIDEYDAPLLDVDLGEEQRRALGYVLHNFFNPLKCCESKLRFVFLTGITKFTTDSIMSGLNNVTYISMNKNYAGICGITKEEMLSEMSDDIDVLARKLELTREETTERLEEYYGGYHFAAKSPDIFNPYSLLNCFSKRKFGSYWFSSGTRTYLINILRKFDLLPNNIAPMEALASEFDAPIGEKTIAPLLYQSGYITIKDYNKDYDYYTLGIPNKEVRVGINFDSTVGGITDWVVE